MAITRSQTLFGRQMPSFDQAKPGYSRLVNSLVSDDIHPSVIQYAEVAIAIADFKLLQAVPYTLVAAPGAGYCLEFVNAFIIYDYAAIYGETSDDLVIRFTDASGAIASTTLDTTSFIDQTSDQIRTFKPITTDLIPVANAPLVLHNSGNGDFTGTGSPIRIKIAYRVHATGL